MQTSWNHSFTHSVVHWVPTYRGPTVNQVLCWELEIGKSQRKGPSRSSQSSVGESLEARQLPCKASASPVGIQVLQENLGAPPIREDPLREDFLVEETSNLRCKITKRRLKLPPWDADLPGEEAMIYAFYDKKTATRSSQRPVSWSVVRKCSVLNNSFFGMTETWISQTWHVLLVSAPPVENMKAMTVTFPLLLLIHAKLLILP